jgi:hypothetical protein
MCLYCVCICGWRSGSGQPHLNQNGALLNLLGVVFVKWLGVVPPPALYFHKNNPQQVRRAYYHFQMRLSCGVDGGAVFVGGFIIKLVSTFFN